MNIKVYGDLREMMAVTTNDVNNNHAGAAPRPSYLAWASRSAAEDVVVDLLQRRTILAGALTCHARR